MSRWRHICLSHTRPNTTYVVNVISQFMHNSKEAHLQPANEVLQYLKRSPRNDILFKLSLGLVLEAYTNTDYVGFVVDRRSTIRYCNFLGGNQVKRRNKRKSLVARSSTKAEFHAMAHAICELL